MMKYPEILEYLLEPEIPIIYADGTKIYDDIKKEYKTHTKGFFILAPSGAGKTHFIKNQKENHWIDGDCLWESARALPKGRWWLEGDEVIYILDQRCDVITMQAKKLGFWVMGTSNYWLKPDAIVIPNWKTHKKFIKNREENNYDGGATSKDYDQVLSHRKRIMKWEKQGVPKFDSVEKAVDYLVSTI